MNRSRQLLLLAALFVAQFPLVSSAAGLSCREIGVESPSQPVLLRNASERPVTLALSFEAARQVPLSCGTLTVAAGGDSGALTLASLCPGAAPGANGVLKACAAPRSTAVRRGLASGNLLDDLQANNLAVTGR